MAEKIDDFAKTIEAQKKKLEEIHLRKTMTYVFGAGLITCLFGLIATLILVWCGQIADAKLCVPFLLAFTLPLLATIWAITKLCQEE
jgi:hypothetical protein